MSFPSDLTTDDPTAELFARARAGDDAAWEMLFHECYPKVVRVVRRKLNRPMRSLYDSTDFASDVMKSLAANAGRLDFPSLNALLAFLTRVAEQKVVDEYRKVHTLKRNIDRDLRLNAFAGDESPVGLASQDPTASQVAVASETHEQLLEGQNDGERHAIELKELGYSNDEIAMQTGWNLRKVQRFFKDLGDRFRPKRNAG